MAITETQKLRLPGALILLCRKYPADARPIVEAVLGTLTASQETALFNALKALAQEKHDEEAANAQDDIDRATKELLDPFDP